MTSTAKRNVNTLNRIGYALLIFLISLLVTVVFLGMAFVVEGQWGHNAFIRWGGLAGFTLGLFGLFIGYSEKFLQSWRFWGLTSILLVGHLAVFAMLLTHVDEWKLPWFMAMVVELPPFVFLRDNFVEPRG